MSVSPDLVGRLRAIKSNLEHTRRFKLHPNDWLSAVTQAEGDIEELLIDYGFQTSDERDPDRNVHVKVDHEVAAGSGHSGNYRNRTYEQAKADYDREAAVPSYFGKGVAGGGTGLQRCSLMRITTIVETLEKNS